MMSSSAATPRRSFPNSPFNKEPIEVAEVYEVDDRVVHDRYGLGRLTKVEGERAVHVDFGSHLQRVLLPCRQMTKL